MPALTGSSPIADLGLPADLTDRLRRANIATVSRLTTYARIGIARLSIMREGDIELIDAALTRAGLSFDRVGGTAQICKRCPKCPTCSHPRARDRRNIAVDYRGHHVHVGFPATPPCDDCDQHHRQLWNAAAAA